MTVKRQIKKTKKQNGSGKNRKDSTRSTRSTRSTGSTRSKSENTSSLKRTSFIKQEVSPVMNLDVGDKQNPKLTINTKPLISNKEKEELNYSPIGIYIKEQINAFEEANPGKTLDPEDVWLEKEKQIGIPKPAQVVPAYKNMSIKEFNNTLSQITNIVGKNSKNKKYTISQTKTKYSRDIQPPSRQIEILRKYLKTEPQGPLSEIISYMVNPNKKGTPGYIRPMLSRMYNKT